MTRAKGARHFGDWLRVDPQMNGPLELLHHGERVVVPPTIAVPNTRLEGGSRTGAAIARTRTAARAATTTTAATGGAAVASSRQSSRARADQAQPRTTRTCGQVSPAVRRDHCSPNRGHLRHRDQREAARTRREPTTAKGGHPERQVEADLERREEAERSLRIVDRRAARRGDRRV